MIAKMRTKTPLGRPISGADTGSLQKNTASHNAKTNGFTEILRDLPTDQQLPMNAIRVGFPASMLKDTGLYFGVPTQRIEAMARPVENTAHAFAKSGVNLDAAASERIWRLSNLMSIASRVFEEEEAAKNWLRTPNRAFGSVAPMDYLDTEPGAMAVRQVLNAIAMGGVV